MMTQSPIASLEATMEALHKEVAELNIMAQKIGFIAELETMKNEEMQMVMEREQNRILAALRAAANVKK